jgi:hypothetical protein
MVNKSKRTAIADGTMRSIRLAAHVDARVRELARSEGTTMSSVLRRIIAEGVGCSETGSRIRLLHPDHG